VKVSKIVGQHKEQFENTFFLVLAADEEKILAALTTAIVFFLLMKQREKLQLNISTDDHRQNFFFSARNVLQHRSRGTFF
jgi:hypothetical protein